MEEVPRRTSPAPLPSPCFVLCSIRVETEGLLAYQGRAGIISIVRWNLRPVIFGVEIAVTRCNGFQLQNLMISTRTVEVMSQTSANTSTSCTCPLSTIDSMARLLHDMRANSSLLSPSPLEGFKGDTHKP